MQKPIAIMTITTRPTGVLLYELRDAGAAILWACLGYNSDRGREQVRARLRAWLIEHPYKVELASSSEAG